MAPLYNPMSALVYCAHQTDVIFVMINGKITADDGVVKTLDERKILKKLEGVMTKLQGLLEGKVRDLKN
jgi:cytosine/adenosine deaminase-related metal-dependent hydrolase